MGPDGRLAAISGSLNREIRLLFAPDIPPESCAWAGGTGDYGDSSAGVFRVLPPLADAAAGRIPPPCAQAIHLQIPSGDPARWTVRAGNRTYPFLPLFRLGDGTVPCDSTSANPLFLDSIPLRLFVEEILEKAWRDMADQFSLLRTLNPAELQILSAVNDHQLRHLDPLRPETRIPLAREELFSRIADASDFRESSLDEVTDALIRGRVLSGIGEDGVCLDGCRLWYWIPDGLAPAPWSPADISRFRPERLRDLLPALLASLTDPQDLWDALEQLRETLSGGHLYAFSRTPEGEAFFARFDGLDRVYADLLLESLAPAEDPDPLNALEAV